MSTASIHKGFIGKTLLSILVAALVVFGVSANSFVFAQATQTGPTINFVTIENEDAFDYSSTSDGYIYFNTMTISSDRSGVTISDDGKTLTDGNITITVCDGLALDWIGGSPTYGNNSLSDVAYAIGTTEALTTSSDVIYGSDENPAIQITVTNAGATSDGTPIDVVYTISTVSVKGYYYSSGNQTDGNVYVVEFQQGRDLFAYGFWLAAYRAGIQADCTVSVYYSGTDNLASGYDIIWKVTDVDQPSRLDTLGHGGTYSEAILFKSGFTNPVYITKDTTTATDLYQYNGTWYTRIYGSQPDGNTLNGGFITKISGGTFEFVWIGSGCSTQFALASTQAAYTAGLRVEKTVSGTNPSTDEAFIFTVTLDEAISGTFGDMTFESGVATFTLTANETKTATGLPAGVGYTVTEASSENYTSTVTTNNAEGSIASGETVTVTFDNERASGNLTVEKTVSGTNPSTDEAFTFTVTLDEEITGTFGDMTFENGVATFTLTANQSATATALPAGVGYTVTESNNAGYTVSATVNGNEADPAGVAGTIGAGGSDSVVFNNHRDAAIPDLLIIKTGSATTAEPGDTVDYTLAVSQTVEGATATDVVVTDTIPEGLTYVDGSVMVTVNGVTVEDIASYESGVLTVSLGDVAYGDEIEITYQAIVDEGTEGESLTNVAKVTSDNAGEDEDDWTITVTDETATTNTLPKTGDTTDALLSLTAAVALGACVVAAASALRMRRHSIRGQHVRRS